MKTCFVLQASPETIRATAKTIEIQRAQFRANYLKVYREVASMREGEWTGAASDSFIEQIDIFREDFDLLDNYLNELAVYLMKVCNDFAALEQGLITDILKLPELDVAGIKR